MKSVSTPIFLNGSQKKSGKFSLQWAGLIGNILEHYDSALFSLLAPFLAPLFFGGVDPLLALIYTYSLLAFGFIAKPLGAIVFGRIGDRLGRSRALCYSLSGMSLITVCIGCLPVYQSIGKLAPLFLALARFLQSFFAAGETTGGALFLLEPTEPQRRGFISSVYDASTVGGILLAAFLITLLGYCSDIQKSWRILFWLGGMTAIVGVTLRLKIVKSVTLPVQNSPPPLWQVLKQYKRQLLVISLVAGFSYVTYVLAFTLMNGWLPLVSKFSKIEVMESNTHLLIWDMLLLPAFGLLACLIGKQRLMVISALGVAITTLPLMYLLTSCSEQSSLFMVRFVFVALGVAFSAPYHAWAMELIPKENRYTVLSLGYALGSQIIGGFATTACLFLYRWTHWKAAPALYFIFFAFFVLWAIKVGKKSSQPALD